MRAWKPIGVLIAMTSIGASAAISAEASVRAPARIASVRPPARMLVYAQEWSLWPSRSSLPAGRVTVQLWNRGEDSHDLRIRRLDRRGDMVGSTKGVAVTASAAITQASWRLKPGRYELYCSMPGHLARGMHVKLTVR